jgi:hypothetical protein
MLYVTTSMKSLKIMRVGANKNCSQLHTTVLENPDERHYAGGSNTPKADG